MSLTRRLRFTGSPIADHRIHGRPHEDAGQSIPLLAGERVKLRRRRQTSGEPASLDLEVLRGVVVRLVLAFPLAVVPVPVVLVPAMGPAAPSSIGHCNLRSGAAGDPPSARVKRRDEKRL
jgi:hypothetical protein